MKFEVPEIEVKIIHFEDIVTTSGYEYSSTERTLMGELPPGYLPMD